MKIIYIPNSEGNLEKVEVSEELAFVIDSFRREEESQLRQNRRYMDYYSSDISLFASSDNVEDKVIEHETMRNILSALGKLTEKERKRILAYYFKNLTYEQVAKIENTSTTAIFKSVGNALEKLKKFVTVK